MEIILLILVLVFLTLWLVERGRSVNVKADNQDRINALSMNLQGLNVQLEEAKKYIQLLSKYQTVVDAEKEAKRIIEEARQNALEIVQKGQNEIKVEKAEITKIKQEVTETRKKIKIEYEEAILRAVDTAKEIVAKALIEAESKGGYTIEKAKELEQLATAIENRINGYGNKYLKSSFSILDELTEDYGHKEAGHKLRAARDVSRILLDSGKAATCDYVETIRKETAINFILDAFNGKVEVVFSKVKKDNYGTLERQVQDAYYLVNNLGKAFRNTAITKEYLNSKLEELKWACVVQELKWQEQEEQRAIREQIREEEKARRDFEKAIRDAQKEEETLKKLIEKAQQQVQQSNDEQRAKYENKLLELEKKLIEAEEKNQRALSMAQQTKSGNVYIISNIGSFGENVYKIGMTRRLEPMDRIKELGDASVPFEFDVHAMIYSDDAPKLERELHKKFLINQMNKVNPRKEFFKIGLLDIKLELERQKIDTKWTMVAEARQYRETLALEEEIANNAAKRIDWEQQQIKQEQKEQLYEIEEVA